MFQCFSFISYVMYFLLNHSSQLTKYLKRRWFHVWNVLVCFFSAVMNFFSWNFHNCLQKLNYTFLSRSVLTGLFFLTKNKIKTWENNLKPWMRKLSRFLIFHQQYLQTATKTSLDIFFKIFTKKKFSVNSNT